MIRKFFFELVLVGLCYLIRIVAALPVGISTGGLSFFRFDQGDNSFPEDNYFFNLTLAVGDFKVPVSLFVALWWSPFQLFCFFLYSYFARKATWTVSTNYPKVK